MRRLTVYRTISRLSKPRSFVGKILVIAFVGTHIPLIGLVSYLFLSHDGVWYSELDVLLVVLATTLLGTVLTLFLLHGLVQPLTLTADAMGTYLRERRLLELPEIFDDQVGRLMRNVSYTLSTLEARQRELDEVAASDPVTGVYSRRAGELAMGESLARLDRDGTPLTILLVRLEDFATINENHGYAVGDQCMRRLAEGSRALLRATDWIARTDVDEFTIGLSAPAADAVVVANRLEERLRDIPFRTPAGAMESARGQVVLATAHRGDTATSLRGRLHEEPGNRKAAMTVATLIGFLLLCGTSGAQAAQKLAVFDYEMINTSLEATRPDEAARLAKLAADTRAAYAERGFEIVDVAPVARDIASLPSLVDCNGCQVDLGRKLGADYVAVGWIQKVSNLILNMNLRVNEVATGKLYQRGSADLRGNTGESWDRTLAYLLKNRIFVPR